MQSRSSDPWRIPPLPLCAAALALAVITAVVFSPSLNSGFIHLDDDVYVLDNPNVQKGFTLNSLEWAFTTFYANFWHPLTWLSLILDYELYGLNPAGYHATNLILHVLSSVLLLAILWISTQKTVASWIVACLFALHPLHVESVVWISERKDVLSTFFWMLALLAYVNYQKNRTSLLFGAGLAAYILGLMAKPMLVTFPLVLLLLDYWPLGRLPSKSSGGRMRMSLVILKEKMPFLIPAIAFSILTLVAQEGNPFAAMQSSFLERAWTVFPNYFIYLRKCIWPTDLAVVYPIHHPMGMIEISFSFGFFLAVTFLAFYWRARRPYVFVGWLWYAVTLLPVIGVVPVGPFHVIADRYTYIPLIGVFVIFAYGIQSLLEKARSQRRRLAEGIAMVCVSALFIPLAQNQIAKWQDSMTLFEHTISVTRRNPVAHNNLGIAYSDQGRYEDAREQFLNALRIEPESEDAHYNLGTLDLKQNKTDDAIDRFRRVLELNPGNERALVNLGIALSRARKLEEAIAQYQEALRLNQGNHLAYNNLGQIYLETGDFDRAIEYLTQSLRIRPDFAVAYNNTGLAYLRKGQAETAIRYLEKAVSLDPDYVNGHFNLALALKRASDPESAIKHLEKVLAIAPDFSPARIELQHLHRAGTPQESPKQGR